jgi:hypothetical protein
MDDRMFARTTDGSLDCNQAIEVTIAGAQITSLHVEKRLMSPLAQLAGARELKVTGLEARTSNRSWGADR